jgi:hypothetical protein
MESYAYTDYNDDLEIQKDFVPFVLLSVLRGPYDCTVKRPQRTLRNTKGTKHPISKNFDEERLVYRVKRADLIRPS